jgi:hypothetical protein
MPIKANIKDMKKTMIMPQGLMALMLGNMMSIRGGLVTESVTCSASHPHNRICIYLIFIS